MAKHLLIFFTFVLTISVRAQRNVSDKDLFDLYKARQFSFLEIQNHPKSENYFFYRAVYFNVSNKPLISQKYVDSVEQIGIPAKLEYEFYELKSDNYVKLFDYKNAASSTRYLIDHFPDKFNADQKRDAENTYRVWEVLSNEQPQTIPEFKSELLPYTRDLAGLINLKVEINSVECDFVFDTGANISCITDVQAEKMGVRILPDNNIEVKGYNGISNKVRMGVASSLKFGNIEIQNALFLVFREEAFTFANGAYKINGIIGFPIAKDLGTITIGKETVGFEKMQSEIPVQDKNLFLQGLTPILLLKHNNELLPFSFDTGADKTDLSNAYYLKFKKEIKKAGKPSLFQEASAGGASFFKGIQLKSAGFYLGNQEIILTEPIVNLSQVQPEGQELYGNVGQDLLKQYSTVVISFDNNYLRLIK